MFIRIHYSMYNVKHKDFKIEILIHLCFGYDNKNNKDKL